MNDPKVKRDQLVFESDLSASMEDVVTIDFAGHRVVVAREGYEPEVHKPVCMPHVKDCHRASKAFLIAAREGRLPK